MNRTRTPEECIETAIHQIRQYLDDGACSMCAFRMTSRQFNLDMERLMDLYVDQLIKDQ